MIKNTANTSRSSETFEKNSETFLKASKMLKISAIAFSIAAMADIVLMILMHKFNPALALEASALFITAAMIEFFGVRPYRSTAQIFKELEEQQKNQKLQS